MRTVFQTREFQMIDKSQWPRYVKDYIDNPDVNSIHTEIGTKIAFRKFNTEAFPRLAFFEERVGNNVVFVLRKFFREHRNYEEFRKLPRVEQERKCKYTPQEKAELKEYIDSLSQENSLPPLEDNMRDYERTRDFSNTGTTYVFEMDEWCLRLRKGEELTKYLSEIYNTICNVIINRVYPDGDEDGWIRTSFSKQSQKKIILRVHNWEEHAYFYLFDIIDEANINEIKDRYDDLSDLSLLKRARKGYPDWILCDDDMKVWESIEDDDEANLALSDEEVDVLNNTQYPFFINGLAGSGKSTILYYLFAKAYSYSAIRKMDFLFLSYSDKLVDKAKTVIKSLLKRNPGYQEFTLTDELEKHLDDCFSPFTDYIINQFVETEEEYEHFSLKKHMSYELFKKEYSSCRLVEAKAYKASMVWSVIRTFIKGRDYNSFFDAENYQNCLYDNDRTVSIEDYKNIYTIWNNWYYNNYSNSYWDDLDLVRFALSKIDNGAEYKKYDIIYCDEAQDFTPIENLFILKLSKYSYYNLNNYANIPIAYAGDPNQTVSPTGFSWRRLKEIFDKSFAEQVGGHISLNEKTLNNNYRSIEPIVEFANSLQYIRKCFLTDDPLHPQERWNPQGTPKPGFFDLNLAEDREAVRNGFEKVECIITGADGEYLLKDNGDEGTSIDTSEDSVPIIEDELLKDVKSEKLYTAITSKGMEYRSVILYKFADSLPESFSKILQNEEINSESDKYELRHFFTKLYIAVSRAKVLLYIADTTENYERFWKYFIDNRFVKELVGSRNNAEINEWGEKIGGIVRGDRNEFLKRIEENFDPKSTAIKVFKDAKSNKDPQGMLRASGYYSEGGKQNDAKKCKAYALLYNYEYEAAGDAFRLLGMEEEATDAYWKGKCWSKLSEFSDKAHLRKAAELMLGQISMIEFIKIDDIISYIEYKDETWKGIVYALENKVSEIEKEYIYTVIGFFNSLVRRGFTFLDSDIANLYFRNKDYKKAIEKWDELNKTDHDDYYESKERMSNSTSDAIYWMNRGRKTKEILDNYSDPDVAVTLNLDERARGIVFNLLLKRSFERALAYPYNENKKLQLLFEEDNTKFVELYVLNEFSEDKFVEWIENPIRQHNSDLFDTDIPQSLLDKVFALPQMDDWILFMKLKDNGGYRVMRNNIIVNKVADAVSKALSNKNYKSLASCFLDVVFNNPYYNYANAKKHLDTIIEVFTKNDFRTADFILRAHRNEYFDSCRLDEGELNNIKDKLRGFVEEYFAKEYITGSKRVKQSDYQTIKTLFYIYEKVAPRVRNERGRYVYDANTVLSFYETIHGKVKKIFPQTIIDYIDIRRAVVADHYLTEDHDFSIEKLVSERFSVDAVLNTCDKEDTLWLAEFVMKGKDIDYDKVSKWLIPMAKVLYNKRITRIDFRKSSRRSMDEMSDRYIKSTDYSIDNLLSKGTIEDISLKWYAYLYELFIEKTDEKATKLNALSNDTRLARYDRLVRYIQRRALHYYALIGADVYTSMCEKYGISILREMAKEEVRPIIKEDSRSPIDGGNTNTGGAIEPPQDEPQEKQDDAEKKGQLEVAQNLKEQGFPIETILSVCKRLTREDVENL